MKSKPSKFQFDFKKFYSDLKYYLAGLYHKFEEDHIWIMSASIAFNIIICIIPITLILFSIIGFYLSGENISSALDNSLNKVVGMTHELKEKISGVVLAGSGEIANNTTLTAIVGTLGILWTASGLFSTIRDVLNRIYKTRDDAFYLWGKLRDIGMVILISVIFLLSFSSTFIFSIFKAIDETFFGNALLSFGFAASVLSHGIGLLFTFIMFYLIFKLVPQGFVNQKVAVISSLTATILSETIKILFIMYLVSFANYQKVYGAYAAIVAVIFWLYYSSLTFVIGAEIGQLYKEKKLIKE
ncbi:MAG: YihY/virulence factor BrkB family protein [Chlorobi bacterium]|nr:YihY/virulence factor BrkB family protein [Chlorobiota bacterium]MCI0717222.1 YihY/virulence factor BrkB family protein [Chlorobiota bacterium]